MRYALRSFLLLVLVSAAFFGLSPAAAAAGSEMAPIATRKVLPLHAAPAPAAQAVAVPAAPPFEGHAVPENEYEELRQAAATDPYAPAADQVVAVPGSAAIAPSSVTTSFAGLNYLTAGATPPDTIVAKSGYRVLEATNSALRLFNTSGSVLATSGTAVFLGLSATTAMTDPKVFFDINATNPRLFLIVEQSPTFNPLASAVYIAVSRTPNPSDFTAASWCQYWIPTVTTIGGVSTFADSPVFGVGADTFVFSTNQYSSTGVFEGVVINAGDKTAVENNAASCPTMSFYVFQPGTPGDNSTFTTRPVEHYTSPSSFTGTTNPVYLVSTHGTGSNIYKVWRIRNVVSGSATLSELDVTDSSSYSTPPSAPQPPGNLAMDEGDVRIRQIAGIGNSLWATHNTVCSVGGANQGCIRVLRFDVGQDGSGNLTASIGQQVTFAGPAGTHYWMPGIAATSAQSTVVPFLYGSTSTYLSSAFTTKSATATSYPAATTLLGGGCGNGIRTGDYQGAQTNPNDLASFWIAGEATPPAGQCSSIWLTQIANVTP